MIRIKFSYMKKERAIPCPSGDRYKDEFKLEQNGNNLSLVKVGRVDVHEQIQSHRDAVSLSAMIERFKRGDTSALERKKGFYADVTDFETNPAQVIQNGREVIRELKIEKAEEKPTDQPNDQSAAENKVTEGEAVNE